MIKISANWLKLAHMPNIVPVQINAYTHSFTAFIGGAADKYSFSPGDIPINYEGNTLGPTYIVGDYAKLMKVEIEKDFKNAFNEYYGYEEAFTGAIRNRKNKTNAFEDIKK